MLVDNAGISHRFYARNHFKNYSFLCKHIG